jgi:superfamily I DNA and/or RNA helicase
MVSTCFYQGEIRSKGPEALEGFNFVTAQDGTKSKFYSPIIWADTSELRDRHEEASRGSYFNRAEASEIVRRLTSLQKLNNLHFAKTAKKLKVLVISFYAAQVNHIKKELDGLEHSEFDIEVLSVDSVQGREADVVFFSPVRSSSNPDRIGFINRERINVALSRARQSLIIVADSQFWNAGSSKLGDVFEYLQAQPSEDFELDVLS